MYFPKLLLQSFEPIGLAVSGFFKHLIMVVSAYHSRISFSFECFYLKAPLCDAALLDQIASVRGFWEHHIFGQLIS